jgi:hypothetical protein
VLAQERLDETSQGKLTGLLAAGDPKGEVTTAWHAKEATRALYAHRDPQLALEWVDQLSQDMRDRDCPPEVRQLGRTMRRWRTQIAAWHEAQVSNGPTENRQRALQTHQADRVRDDQLHPLAHPRPALRRLSRLGQAPHPHPGMTPLICEVPVSCRSF